MQAYDVVRERKEMQREFVCVSAWFVLLCRPMIVCVREGGRESVCVSRVSVCVCVSCSSVSLSSTSIVRGGERERESQCLRMCVAWLFRYGGL